MYLALQSSQPMVDRPMGASVGPWGLGEKRDNENQKGKPTKRWTRVGGGMSGAGVLKKRRETTRHWDNERTGVWIEYQNYAECHHALAHLFWPLSTRSLVPQDRGHRYSARREEKIPNLAHFYVLPVLPCLNPTDMRSVVPNSIRPHHSIILPCLLFNIIFSIFLRHLQLSYAQPLFPFPSLLSNLSLSLFIHPLTSTSPFSSFLRRESGALTTKGKEGIEREEARALFFYYYFPSFLFYLFLLASSQVLIAYPDSPLCLSIILASPSYR